MTAVGLNDDEISLLARFDPTADRKVQELLADLAKRVCDTKQLELTDAELESIQLFAFQSTGGSEIRFLGIFGRTLGPRLGLDVGQLCDGDPSAPAMSGLKLAL